MVKKKSKRKEKKVGKREKKEKVTQNSENIWKCSKSKVMEALAMLRKEAEYNNRRIRVGRCGGSTEVILPHHQPYLVIQIRNALITHNWEAAALFLRMLLKNPSKSYPKFIWRAFFLVMQHLPTDISERMERFEKMCTQLFKENNFPNCLFMDKEEVMEEK